MRWIKFNALLAGAFCAASFVSAATSIGQNISDMQKLAEKIGAAKDSLDNYNGGIPAALGVARSLIVAQTSAKHARKNLADREPMTPEEGDRFYESYSEMFPILLDAVHSAKDKAPLFNKAGLGPEAKTYLDNLHNEKRLFEKEAQSQVPEDIFRKVQPSANRISAAFDEADLAFQS
ncbi:uncharacterized protein N7469_000094 [Penicillium citrinum]|uniref:DUF4142 domain-containing protein n=2 Tax=Penicillium TaxID=5073 RepID=A0A9W9PD06_PENCI|nr:uncharacterized protein N7469_000094 [Penicillium citrinum]KAJ5241767.1 hypothetical protein N7469_000094 [Penicillium citrinum]KAJ5600787.1 hypothetical protein N7450_001854 [Penicillium hetheringtonii]